MAEIIEAYFFNALSIDEGRIDSENILPAITIL